MNTWPEISTLTSMDDVLVKKSNRKTSAAGYPMSFSAGTVAKRKFKLGYTMVSDSHKSAAEAFFDANQGLIFVFNSPYGGSFSVVFNQDELSFEYATDAAGLWNFNVEMVEV